MIFASVGTMFPFDRLVRAVDAWAAVHPEHEVFIQIGAGTYVPQQAAHARMVPHRDYVARLKAADLFIAHVGMGSIFQALEHGVPALLLPRRHALGEHNTDHQMDTAVRFRDRPGLTIVDDEAALGGEIDRLLAGPRAAGSVGALAPAGLTDAIRGWLGG